MSRALRRAVRRALGLGLVGAVALAGCTNRAVHLAYRPAVGSRAVYALQVTTLSRTRLGAEPEQVRHDAFTLRSEQRVLAGPAGSGTRVSVLLTGDGQQREFLVRLDRSGQLATVETVEGVPAASLGTLGLSELLPAAAGALPRRGLRPGDHWVISESVRLGPDQDVRLVGSGRMTNLGVSGGRSLATVETSVALPVDRITDAAEGGGTVHLVGALRTTMRVTQRAADGVVTAARARSVGRYTITLTPPTATGGPPLMGTLVVEVNSATTEVGSKRGIAAPQ